MTLHPISSNQFGLIASDSGDDLLWVQITLWLIVPNFIHEIEIHRFYKRLFYIFHRVNCQWFRWRSALSSDYGKLCPISSKNESPFVFKTGLCTIFSWFKARYFNCCQLDRFRESILFGINWRSCKHCFNNEWTFFKWGLI